MNEPRPQPRRFRLAALLLLLAPLAACKSSGDKLSKEEREQRISVHTETSALYITMGEFERAVDQAQRGLELDPGNFKLRLYMGRALQKIGGTEEILVAEKVFRSLPAGEDYRVSLGLGEVLERKGMALEESGEAIAAGRRYTQASDRHARAAELRAGAQASWEESERIYQHALSLQPGDLEVLAGLARVNALLGRHERALEWSARMIQSAERDRGFWRRRLEQPNLSTSDQERFLRNLRSLDDLVISVQRKAASLCRELGRPEEAMAHLDAVLALDPKIAEVHARRAQFLAGLGRHREAIAAIDRFLELSGLPFEHADVQQAYRLRMAWQRNAEHAESEASGQSGRLEAPPAAAAARRPE